MSGTVITRVVTELTGMDSSRHLTDWHLDSWFLIHPDTISPSDSHKPGAWSMVQLPIKGDVKNADYKPVSLNSQHNRWSCYSWWKASIPIMSQSNPQRNTKLFCSNMFWWILWVLCDPFPAHLCDVIFYRLSETFTPPEDCPDIINSALHNQHWGAVWCTLVPEWCLFIEQAQIQRLSADYANYWADPPAINYILLWTELY